MTEDLGLALDRAQRRLRRATAERSAAVVASYLAGHREPTRSAYRHDVEAFLAHLRRLPIDLLDARPEDIGAHVAALRSTGAAPATIRRQLAAISGLYRHARDLRVSTADPVAGVPRPPDSMVVAPSSTSKTARADAMTGEAVLRAAEASGSRDRALVLLIAQTGLRLGEALAIAVGDIHVGDDGVALRVRSPHRAGRELLLPPPCAQACLRLTRGRRDGPLLITSSGRGLDRHHARRIVGRVGARAGLGDRLTPRTLREAFISRALSAGVEPGALAGAVGLGDPRRLRRYGPGADRPDASRSLAIRLGASI